MATQHNVQEILTTDGNPCYVEVANRDAAGNVINTTYGALGGNNTWTGTNTFNGDNTFDGLVSLHGGLIASNGESGAQLRSISTTGDTITHRVGTSQHEFTFPNRDGTFALTSDIPSLSGYATQNWVNTQIQANPSDEGSTNLVKLKVGNVVYNIPNQGSGDVTASGNNTFTGTNTFNGDVTFDGTVHSDLEFDSASGFTLGNANTGYFGTNFKVNGNAITLPSTTGTLATQEWVTSQGYAKAAALSDFVTQSMLTAKLQDYATKSEIPVKAGSVLQINW